MIFPPKLAHSPPAGDDVMGTLLAYYTRAPWGSGGTFLSHCSFTISLSTRTHPWWFWWRVHEAFTAWNCWVHSGLGPDTFKHFLGTWQSLLQDSFPLPCSWSSHKMQVSHQNLHQKASRTCRRKCEKLRSSFDLLKTKHILCFLLPFFVVVVVFWVGFFFFFFFFCLLAWVVCSGSGLSAKWVFEVW